MPNWLIILITVLGTVMIVLELQFSFIVSARMHQLILGLHLYFYIKGTLKTILSGCPQQLIGYPKVKATPETVRETLEMLGIDFSGFDKCKTCKDSKDRSKIATTSV